MKNLKIELYKPKKVEKLFKAITIPLKTIDFGIQLLPKEIKDIMEKQGIDLSQCSDLIKEKELKGKLIEIENIEEKVVILAD